MENKELVRIAAEIKADDEVMAFMLQALQVALASGGTDLRTLFRHSLTQFRAARLSIPPGALLDQIADATAAHAAYRNRIEDRAQQITAALSHLT
jgi:hypothetical protein